MGRTNIEGTCRLCGAFGKLSFEHVPPKKAFNSQRVVLARREQMLVPGPWDGRRGEILQKGAGGHTLCERCNTTTGDWYAKEYARWAGQGASYLDRIPLRQQGPVRLRFYGRPLRFLKQVVTMFFSANEEGFSSRHRELVRFVLNWRSQELPARYRIDMVLVRGGFFRSVGMHGTVNLTSGVAQVASEVAHYPFAHRFIISDRPVERLGPIEWFAGYGPEDTTEVVLPVVTGDVATKFPGDYRSRAQVDREANRE